MSPAPGPDERDIDVLIVGGGVAGMATALACCASRSVTLVTKESLDDSATRWAQGGIAAALAFPDSPDLHLRDTVEAGAGMCDTEALRVLVDEGPARVEHLLAQGARFDREGGTLALAREGGHSMARILRAGGDATGAEIQRSMGDLVRESSLQLVQDCRAVDLLIDDGRCVGLRVVDYDASPVELRAGAVVLATGGAGGLYDVTTNPDVATADGLAMALRAGAVSADLEFVQFHPTALVVDERPRPLVSEAVRGEGAILRRADGSRVMAGVHPMQDLAPRDVVSQAVFRAMVESGDDHVYLDATGIADFGQRFPTITAICAAHGLDPREDWLPVAPAAHYYCGGVVTDLTGRTSIPGLYAVGEVACTGVHGANRLASNSLLEGLVFGARLGEALAAGDDGMQRAEGVARPLGETAIRVDTAVVPSATADDPTRIPTDVAIPRLRRAMSRGAGVVRTRESLEATHRELEALAARTRPGRASLESLLVVADALTLSANVREESRGCHVRADFPETRPELATRLYQRRLPGGRVEVFR